MDLTTIGSVTKNESTINISNNNNNNSNHLSNNNNQNDKNLKGFTKFWNRWKNCFEMNHEKDSNNKTNGCTCFEYFSNANLFILCCIAACFSMVCYFFTLTL